VISLGGLAIRISHRHPNDVKAPPNYFASHPSLDFKSDTCSQIKTKALPFAKIDQVDLKILIPAATYHIDPF